MLHCEYNPAIHFFPEPQPECIIRLRKAVGLGSIHAMLHKDFGHWEVVMRGVEPDGRPIFLELGFMGSGNGEGPTFSGECYDDYVRKLKRLLTVAEVRQVQRQRGADQLRKMENVNQVGLRGKRRVIERVRQRCGDMAAERAEIGYGIRPGDFDGVPK